MLIGEMYEWQWPAKPEYHGEVLEGQSDIHSLNGHGQLTILKDRDHLAGDPPPNTAVPESRLVILFRMPEMQKIRSGWSGTDGSIMFTYLDMTVPYMVFSPGFVGPTGARFDSVCTDSHEDGSLIYPELMAP